MSVKVIKDDVKKVLASIKDMGAQEVLIGIPSKNNHRDDKGKKKTTSLTNAEIGYINEKGSPAQNIPPRPWLVPGVAKAQEKAVGALEKSVKKAFGKEGAKAIEKGLNAAGVLAQNSVKKYIQKGENFKPLSEATLKARRSRGKRRTKPLIDTAQLINSITYVVRKK